MNCDWIRQRSTSHQIFNIDMFENLVLKITMEKWKHQIVNKNIKSIYV